ncbi:hypothetical protein O0L34_g16894 [Tuta absoluta]|nr:hypothetical protein O0L34_g16894 [Tuta absoluta]
MALARTLCINCNIAADGLRHYHFNAMDMDLEIVSLIEEWTAREVADGDNICQECFDLLVIELNNRSEGNIGERQFGHRFVCILCGLSLARQTGRRSRPLRSATAEHAYISNIINPRQVPDFANTCNACWLRAHNAVQRFRVQDNVEVVLPAPASGSSSFAEPSSSNVEASSEPSSDFPGIEDGPRMPEETRILLQG